jgi:prokaryotic membrane lipoprotein lipid attachment site
MKKIIFPILAVTLLAACSSSRTSSDVSLAESVIAQKISVAAAAQQDYLAILNEDSRLKTVRRDDFDNELIDVDYIGKPLPMLNAMANRYGYSLIEIGKRRDLRIINIRMKSVAPIEMLRNVSNQINYAADIILDKNSGTLRVIYK